MFDHFVATVLSELLIFFLARGNDVLAPEALGLCRSLCSSWALRGEHAS
jgi:hypothetical protein